MLQPRHLLASSTANHASNHPNVLPPYSTKGGSSLTVATNCCSTARKPVKLSLPILPELQHVLDQTDTGHLSFLVTQHGRPFTANGFGNWFRKQCDAAGLKHCSAHGLRKAGAAIAAENGATERQLMAMFGWSTLKEASRYTRSARQKILATAGMQHLSRHQNVPKG